jgi:hypothetical protein
MKKKDSQFSSTVLLLCVMLNTIDTPGIIKYTLLIITAVFLIIAIHQYHMEQKSASHSSKNNLLSK